jgi:hypothetical protein
MKFSNLQIINPSSSELKTEQRRANVAELLTLCTGLSSTHTLGMTHYRKGSSNPNYDCSTVCCLVGHAFHNGIGRTSMYNTTEENYTSYSSNELCTMNSKFKSEAHEFTCTPWDFLFSQHWEDDWDEAICRLRLHLSGDYSDISFKDLWYGLALDYSNSYVQTRFDTGAK